jgi:hypothetical protein
MVPVISLAEAGAAADAGGTAGAAEVCGIATDAVLSRVFGADELTDCRPIGVGEVIEGAAGAGGAGFGAVLGGRLRREPAARQIFHGGSAGRAAVEQRHRHLKVPSTITTTLAPTSSERILEVIVDDSSVAGRRLGGGAGLLLARGGGSLRGAARGGDEAR